jgi:hypothetical protein
VIDLTGSCRRHRAVLMDFVDRRDLGPSAEAALAHLDRCGRCVSELEATALTITALRRLGELMARQEPRSDAWPRLRTRIESRPESGFRGRGTRAGHLAGAALIGCLVASVVIGGPGPNPFDPPSAPAGMPDAAQFIAPAENPSRSRVRPRPQQVLAPAHDVRIHLAMWTGPDGLGITLPQGLEAGSRPSGPI